MGADAGKNLTTADQNSFLGSRAGEFTTTGSENVLMGFDAGREMATGNSNTIIGTQCGRSLNSGSANVMLGYRTAFFKTTGHNNTFLGNYTGWNNLSGSGNVFIGHGAGYNEPGNNRLYIDNSITSSPLIYGEFNTKLLRVNGTLNINNAFSFPSVDGNNGQVLASNGNGTVSWKMIATIKPFPLIPIL